MKSFTTHYKELLKLGTPIIIGQLGIILVSFIDTFMVGQHGTEDLAAASFVNNMFNLAIIFATGFSYGLTPIIGKQFGRGKYKEAGTTLKSALLANGIMATFLVVVMGVLYANIGNLGQPEELLYLMKPYFIILLMTLPFIMLFNAFKQFFDGITKTKIPMWILLCGNVINITGNYLLIFGKCGMPELGLLGAGIATLVARMTMLALIIAVFFSKNSYKKYINGFLNGKTTFSELRLINRIGLPVALQMGMEAASFSFTTIMVGWIGTTALAAHQIMVTVSQLGFMIYYGMAAAVAVKASNYCGTGETTDIRRVAAAGFRIITIMAVITSLIIFLSRNNIGGLFIENTEVAVLVSQQAIPFVLYQFGDGMQCTYANALRGITDVKPIMLFAFIAYFIISLPSGYLFGFVLDWGLPGVWMSFPLGLTSAGIMFYLRFRSKVRT